MANSGAGEVNGVVEVYEMLQAVVRCLVDNPNKIEITVVPQDRGTLFRVLVSPKDIGKVIGASGRTSRAIRIMINAASVKHKLHYSLDIVDGRNSQSAGDRVRPHEVAIG